MRRCIRLAYTVRAVASLPHWRRPADHTVPHGPRDVKQVWFPGVYCDVEGGYPEGESGISKITLEWTLDEAAPPGMLVDQHKKGVKFWIRRAENATFNQTRQRWRTSH